MKGSPTWELNIKGPFWELNILIVRFKMVLCTMNITKNKHVEHMLENKKN